MDFSNKNSLSSNVNGSVSIGQETRFGFFRPQSSLQVGHKDRKGQKLKIFLESIFPKQGFFKAANIAKRLCKLAIWVSGASNK